MTQENIAVRAPTYLFILFAICATDASAQTAENACAPADLRGTGTRAVTEHNANGVAIGAG